MRIVVTLPEKGIRIDKFLTAKLPQYTRSQIQKVISGGRVKVNNKAVNKHYSVKADEIIEVIDKAEKKKTATKIINVKLIAEENDYLVIEKPAGLLVHPTAKKEDNTLVDWLSDKYPEVKNVGEDPERPGIVHRLDKEVSGLMIIARNQVMFNHLKKQFQNRLVEKKYTALVFGEITKDDMLVDLPLARSKTTGKISSQTDKEKGKQALTNIKVTKRYKNYTEIEVHPTTGRTNQIRVHMKTIGHPIVGDTLYNIKKYKQKFDLKHILLHAYYLSFYNIDHKRKTYKTDLPKVFNEVIKKINAK